MRTSCDIDILVHDRDSEKAKSVLVDEYGYVYHRKGSHDISLFTPTNTHIELHYNLVEDGIANESSEVLKSVWDMSVIRDGYAFCYEMPDEYYYFYHIAHMAKHFEIGGCGIRPFIDLLILDGIQEADVDKRDELLRQGNLLKFANAARKLSRVWFGGDCHDTVTSKLEEYIISGGVYGSIENNVKVQQIKTGNKFFLVMSKIFLPSRYIEHIYPSVKKRKWLIPFMQIRRWITIAVRGISPRAKKALKSNREISSIQAEQMRIFLNELGL